MLSLTKIKNRIKQNKMDLETKFKKETGFNAYENNNSRPKVPSDYYVEWLEEQLGINVVSNCKRDETLELLEEIMTKVKEAVEEVENTIYDPMLECAKHILNNYKIERRYLIVAN